LRPTTHDRWPAPPFHWPTNTWVEEFAAFVALNKTSTVIVASVHTDASGVDT
jgi:hypothetical protein